MAKSLESENLQQSNFSIVFRGYDRDEVDAYVAELEQLVRADAGTQGKTRAEIAELLGEEVGALLAAAEDAADAIRRRAEDSEGASAAEAEKILQQATSDAAKTRSEAVEEAQRKLQEAELMATRLENAAKQRHDELLEEAKERIKMLRERERELLNRIDALEKAFVSMRHAADDIYKHNAPAPGEEPQPVVDLTQSKQRGKA